VYLVQIFSQIHQFSLTHFYLYFRMEGVCMHVNKIVSNMHLYHSSFHPFPMKIFFWTASIPYEVFEWHGWWKIEMSFYWSKLPSLDWLMLNLLRTFPRSLRNDEFNNKSLTLMMIDCFPFSKSSWLLPCPSFQIISVSLTYSFLSSSYMPSTCMLSTYKSI
jgi:hypothetical protein